MQMQNQGKKKKPVVEEVRKPIITGSWHGKDALKLAWKSALSFVVVTFVYLIAGILFNFDSLWGRILTCAAVVLATAYYLYISGMAQGQTDAAFGEILYGRKEAGHAIPDDERERSFHPLKGLFAVAVGSIPFVLFTLVFALMTEKVTFSLSGLPAWTNSLMAQTEFADGLRYYQSPEGMTALDVMRIIARSMVMPFINVAAYVDSDAALLVERLSPLLILIAPMGYALGYTQGLNVRVRINTGIKMGDDKKKRKERKARKKRQRSKSPEQLI